MIAIKLLFQSITVSADESRLVEMLTRRQHEYEDWHKQREGRLTASSIFHDEYVLKTNPQGLFTRLIKPKGLTTVPTVLWGIAHEEVARHEYIDKVKFHDDFVCY